jgi:hypothetical protein
MIASKGTLIHLHQRDPQEALERLNRITGLRFSSWPQSLVNANPDAEPDEPVTQPDIAPACGSAGVLSG